MLVYVSAVTKQTLLEEVTHALSSAISSLENGNVHQGTHG